MTRETESNDASSPLFEKHFVENPCLRAIHDYVNHKAPQAAGWEENVRKRTDDGHMIKRLLTE